MNLSWSANIKTWLACQHSLDAILEGLLEYSDSRDFINSLRIT